MRRTATRRGGILLLATWLAVTFAPSRPGRVLAADDLPRVYTYWLDVPEHALEATPGSPARFDVRCALRQSSIDEFEPGIEAWSLSVASEHLDITGITTAGTVAASVDDDPPGLRQGGFEKSELAVGGTGDCEGLSGAVSTVILALGDPVYLPRGTTQEVARLTLEGVYPGPGESVDAWLEYVDGCLGTDQPGGAVENVVENIVTYRGQTVRPSLGRDRFELIGRPPCPQQDALLQIVVQTENVGESDELLAAVAPAPDPALPAEVVLPPGGAELWVGLVSQLAPDHGGVQGWSFSIALEGTALLESATTRGTVAGPVEAGPPGIEDSGFEKTEIVDPTGGFLEPQGQGVVSAVVLSFLDEVRLRPDGAATLLQLSIVGEEGDRGLVRCKDLLRGSGGPVSNSITVDGTSFDADCCQWAEIRFEPLDVDFVRGDVNRDGRIDVSDPVAILGCKFLGTGCIDCRDVMDVDDDGAVNVTDPVRLLNFLFLGGPPPSAPWPGCGPDPTPDAWRCTSFAPCSGR